MLPFFSPLSSLFYSYSDSNKADSKSMNDGFDDYFMGGKMPKARLKDVKMPPAFFVSPGLF